MNTFGTYHFCVISIMDQVRVLLQNNYSQIIMLRKLSVLIAPLHKSAKLANTYQLQLLAKKLQKQDKQLPLFKQFQKTRKLPSAFQQKQIQNFNLEDVYFFLKNKEKFASPSQEVYDSMIRSFQLDCLSRFVIAHQTLALYSQKNQIVLMAYFNESCLDMSVADLVECLKIMIKFDRLVRMSEINYQKIKLRIKSEEKNMDLHYLEILYYFYEMGMLEKVIDRHSAKAHLRKFSEQIKNLGIGIKHLYFLDVLEQQLKLHPSGTALKHREKLLSNRITGAKTDEQLEYSLKTVKKYIQFVYLLNIEKQNCDIYKQYLEFIKKSARQNENFFIANHPLPNKVIQTSTIGSFKQILKLRVELDLSKIQDYGKLVRKILEYNAEVLTGLLQYLVIEDVSDYRLWMEFQSGFIEKLHINSKILNLAKIQQQVNIGTIFNILSYMSKKKLGSINFWKPCHRLIYNIIMDGESLLKIDQTKLKGLILSTYEIFQSQTMQEDFESKLKDLTVICLVNYQWNLMHLYRLTKCLTFSKYVCPQIWYAIESKLLIMYNHGASNNQKNHLSMILQYATQMEVGSFKFYSHMKKIGVSKLKVDGFSQNFQKKEVKVI